MTTGHFVLAAAPWHTDPSRSPLNGLRPRDPSTNRSACSDAAIRASVGSPSATTVQRGTGGDGATTLTVSVR